MRNTKTQKGFTIGEVLVAMFILLIGIVDAVFLTVRSVGELRNSRDAVVASLLAQEGTELVRNVRDNTVTQSQCGSASSYFSERPTESLRWNRCPAFASIYGFPSVIYHHYVNTITCTVDARLSSGSPLKCTGSTTNDRLYRNPANGLYTHASGGNVETPFRRRVYIEYGITDGSYGSPESANKIYADVTSVVIYGSSYGFGSVNINDVEHTCLKARNCAYAQTRLSSWINTDRYKH